jgi:hypothetical protein
MTSRDGRSHRCAFSTVHGVHGMRYRRTSDGLLRPDREGVTVEYGSAEARWVRAVRLVRRLNACVRVDLARELAGAPRQGATVVVA